MLPLAYTFFFITLLIVLPHEQPREGASWYEYVGAVARYGILGAISMIVYFVLLVPIMVLSIVLALKDPSITGTMKVSWPFLAGALYVILPDFLPGPVDDLVAAAVASLLGSALLSREWKRRKRKMEREGEVLEVEVLPKATEESGAGQEKPREIIDVEFDEK